MYRRKETFSIKDIPKMPQKVLGKIKDPVADIVKKVYVKIKELIDTIPKKVAALVHTIPKKTWEQIKRIFKPLLEKLKWLFNWLKTLCLCSCLLCLASSCFSLGLPQMILSIIQGAGSVAASQAGGDSAPNTNNLNSLLTDLNNDSSNGKSLDALPTSMAMFNPRPNTGGPAVGSVRMAIATGGPTGPSTNNMPNFSQNLRTQ